MATVKDRSKALGILLLITGVIAVAATFVASQGVGNAAVVLAARIAVAVFGIASLVLGFVRSSNEKRVRGDLDQQLIAERVRILTLTNGAFQGSARGLQEFAAMDLNDRHTQISGLRQSIVEKACDLVRNDRPRAAYFRVDSPTSWGCRKMVANYRTARGRTDDFTSEFVEGDGKDQNVWRLIDAGDNAEVVSRLPHDAPEDFDLGRERAYKSYVSVPVRVWGVALGMLTINSLEENGFTDEDTASVVVLARLLAAAEAINMSTNELNKLKEGASARMASLTQDSGTLKLNQEDRG